MSYGCIGRAVLVYKLGRWLVELCRFIILGGWIWKQLDTHDAGRNVNVTCYIMRRLFGYDDRANGCSLSSPIK